MPTNEHDSFAQTLASTLLRLVPKDKQSARLSNDLLNLIDSFINAEQEGGTCLEWPVSKKDVLNSVIDSGLLCEKDKSVSSINPGELNTPFVYEINEDRIRIYSQKNFAAETALGSQIAVFAKKEREIALSERKIVDKFEELMKEGAIRISAEQLSIINKALNKSFFVITGGPGTGKTTTVVKYLEAVLSSKPDATIYLAAPTGKAQSRLYESILSQTNSEEALYPLVNAAIKKEKLINKTIHRWLTTPTASGSRPSKKNTLECDILIVDEASMIDSALAGSLFEVVNPKRTTLVVLGDKHQLAAVGPGSFFSDISNPKGLLKDNIGELTQSFRFSADKGIGLISRAVNAEGEFAKYSPKDLAENVISRIAEVRTEEPQHLDWDSGAYLQASRLSKAAVKWLKAHLDKYSEGVKKYLVNNPAPTPEDLDALWKELSLFRAIAAQRQGPMSVEAINNYCNDRLLHSLSMAPTEEIYPGKAIIIRKNDGSIGVSNGDVAILYHSESTENPGWFAYIGDLKRSISVHLLPSYESAFAITVHQSQGSGFKDVALFLPNISENSEAANLCTRELIYTGITRAEDHCFIFGSKESLARSIENKTERSGGLPERIKESLTLT